MGKTVIVLASHPDDAELGMGGTIAALCAAGHTVILVDLTDGEPTPHGTPQLRQVESQRAAGILKVSERITLDIKNREIFDTVANREKVATILRRYKPELVCTHYWEDSHPDHVAASALSDAARFYA
ncbi:MAG: bacillithiol biosynthesis deacetylase BshB1, partial [Proteobacteria bacterium]|nr:bacillithiol biosynthesis deacetylase BshB1 [Pseudomonadota bacterium]